jgi:hypothetical protein
LLKDFGGGKFVPVNEWQQLGEVITSLSQNRQLLSQMIEQAGINGSAFTIRKFLRSVAILLNASCLMT